MIKLQEHRYEVTMHKKDGSTYTFTTYDTEIGAIKLAVLIAEREGEQIGTIKQIE